uniref:Uncharacterized protein n=1 Tax=Utricularia reniformis TaxID=192314 RepID=A0A1Y0B3Z0_9LAMI|nr:hypothetical protein AEK19_MT1932 [Utricularia reniformis]ART32097.1 hypothetical protein AEK19_MT1932 [Utricularia reniformis]
MDSWFLVSKINQTIIMNLEYGEIREKSRGQKIQFPRLTGIQTLVSKVKRILVFIMSGALL